MYINMLGGEGVKKATQVAILNAKRCQQAEGSLPGALRRQERPRRPRVHSRHPPDQAATGIAEIDIAKRLMDYGFHAPTVSFPVAGMIMVEPTESESKAELDRFLEAMVSIRGEIRRSNRASGRPTTTR